MKEAMFKFRVLAKVLDSLVPIYVVSARFETVSGELWFWAGNAKTACFAAGEWIGVIVESVVEDGTQ